MSVPEASARPAAQPASQVYTWEPSNQAIAARYGLDPAAVLRFDTNTSPVAPAFVAAVLARAVRSAAQRVPRQRLRGPDRGRGRLRRRCPSRRSWLAPARTRSWTSSPRRSCPRAAGALVPIPTLRHVRRALDASAQRGIVPVPRLGPDARLRPRPGRGHRPACRTCRSSGCARRTTRPGPRSRWPTIERVLAAARRSARPRRSSSSTRRTPSSGTRPRCRFARSTRTWS